MVPAGKLGFTELFIENNSQLHSCFCSYSESAHEERHQASICNRIDDSMTCRSSLGRVAGDVFNKQHSQPARRPDY